MTAHERLSTTIPQGGWMVRARTLSATILGRLERPGTRTVPPTYAQ